MSIDFRKLMNLIDDNSGDISILNEAIKPRSQMYSRREIDLNGPEGNAFVLLGYASNLARQLGLDGDAILKEMQAGDYENLIQVFDSYFGEYVDLFRD